MIRLLLSFLFVVSLRVGFAQQDTVVIKDIKMVLFYSDDGEVKPITTFQETRQASFFVGEVSANHYLRLCNRYPLYLWQQDQLIRKVDGCAVLKLDEITSADTTYFTLSTLQGFANLKCELVAITDDKTVREDLPKFRAQDSDIQYVSLAFLILLAALALFTVQNRSQLILALKKTFSLKINLADKDYTLYKDPSLVPYLILFSLFAGSLFPLSSIELSSSSLLKNLFHWMYASMMVMIFLVGKQALILIFSNLFEYFYIGRRQIVDYLNITFPILVIVWVLLLATNLSNYGDVDFGIISIRLVVLFIILLTIGFLFLKFLNNSHSRKVSIISYLCATEIIPSVLILTWFFK